MAASTDRATESPERRPDARPAFFSRIGRITALTFVIVGSIAVDPALAQSAGTAFCDSDMAETIKNLFILVQFGGPLIGGLIALLATVALPMIRRVDTKREVKEIRNQGIIYGVLVAPLGTGIVRFLLNNVVVGGSSCGF